MLGETKFQNTAYTANATRQPQYSHSSHINPHPQPIDPSFHASRAQSRRSNIPVQMSRVNNQPMMKGDFMVYCPVCRRDYRNSQMGYHAAIHDSTSSFDFRVKVPEYLDCTQDTIVGSGFSYPLVEPLQFYTNQLSDSAHQDDFFFKRGENYDGVDRRLFAEKRQIQVQTLSKPPLQYQSERTNIYNCLDNVVNSDKGPKFSFKDIGEKNEFITPKRQLDEWEQMQIDPSQKTLIAKKKRTWW